MMDWFDSQELRDETQEYSEEELANVDKLTGIVETRYLDFLSSRSVTYLTVVGGLLGLLLVADVVLCGGLPDQFYGLSLDLFGAVVLGRGLLSGKYEIAALSMSAWNYSPELLDQFAKDAVDGLWGITLLITGVLLQFISLSQVFTIPVC